jgi:hypothetical protein
MAARRFLIAAITALMPSAALAQGGDFGATEAFKSLTGGRQAAFASSVTDLLATIISTILGLVGVLFFLLFLYAGFLWLTSRGSQEQLKKAKDILTSAVLGLFVVVSSYAATRFIFRSVTQPLPVSSCDECAEDEYCAASGFGGKTSIACLPLEIGDEVDEERCGGSCGAGKVCVFQGEVGGKIAFACVEEAVEPEEESATSTPAQGAVNKELCKRAQLCETNKDCLGNGYCVPDVYGFKGCACDDAQAPGIPAPPPEGQECIAPNRNCTSHKECVGVPGYTGVCGDCFNTSGKPEDQLTPEDYTCTCELFEWCTH